MKQKSEKEHQISDLREHLLNVGLFFVANFLFRYLRKNEMMIMFTGIKGGE